MALTIGEASAVNTVLDYFLRIPKPSGDVTEQAALEAAQFLAEKANKTLSAGIRPVDVAANWANPARHLAETVNEVTAEQSRLLGMAQGMLDNLADGHIAIVGRDSEGNPEVKITEAGRAHVEAMGRG